jgi:hypothetical protein
MWEQDAADWGATLAMCNGDSSTVSMNRQCPQDYSIMVSWGGVLQWGFIQTLRLPTLYIRKTKDAQRTYRLPPMILINGFTICPDEHHCDNGSLWTKHPNNEGSYHCFCEKSFLDDTMDLNTLLATDNCTFNKRVSSVSFCTNHGTHARWTRCCKFDWFNSIKALPQNSNFDEWIASSKYELGTNGTLLHFQGFDKRPRF